MRLTSRMNRPISGRLQQSGVVLLITLIVLVAMTLASIALMRSVDTTNIIAGNLAFQRSTLLAADTGIEAAVAANTGALAQITAGSGCGAAGGAGAVVVCMPGSVTLTSTFCAPGTGYRSWFQPNLDPPNQSWDAFWNSQMGDNCPATLPADPTNAPGITVSYIIESMCSQNGQVNCLQTPPNAQALVCIGANMGKQGVTCPPIRSKYYRVTSRAVGPRNTVAYVQVIVAM